MKTYIEKACQTIDCKRVEIEKLQTEIRNICFENIQKQKDITVGDIVYIPSKNKFGIFIELHNEDVTNQILKTNLFTKQGMPSKNITTVSLSDLEKVTDSLEDVIKNNFSGEDFDAEKAIQTSKEAIIKLKS